MDYSVIYDKQRAYYDSGVTRPAAFRVDALKKLQKALKENTPALTEALKADLNKQPMEVIATETGMVMHELKYVRRHIKRWMRKKRVTSPLYTFPSRCFMSPEPLGQVLILSPWNYPLQLCLMPLIGAIAAGNCVVLKPSVKAPNTSHAIKAMLEAIYPEDYVYVAEGSRDDTAMLNQLKWDHVFFTGSKDGGRHIMTDQAKFLTPVTLELGGKSPVIVDKTAKIKLAARRIAFGKSLNAGQTCVAPDYLLIHEDVKDQFLAEYEKALKKFFPRSRYQNLVTIINDKHFLRLSSYLEGAEIAVGGMTDPEQRRIQPTVLVNVPEDAPIMQEEIFGPILPLFTWKETNEVVEFIRRHEEKPLALYLFTQDKAMRKTILERCSFGGGCFNDTVMHVSGNKLPFGGVGTSGIGSYHGKQSFVEFSHYRSILSRGVWCDPAMRYFPYGKLKTFFVKMFLNH